MTSGLILQKELIGRIILKSIISVVTLFVSIFMAITIILALVPPSPQIISLDEIKPELDEATNNCFQQIRKNLENNLVYLENADDESKFLINKFDGYSLAVPKDWNLDNVNFEQATILYNIDFKLSIFKQEIDESYDDPINYIQYSYAKIRENHREITHLGDEIRVLGIIQVETVSWKRVKITTIENDLNFYYAYNIITDETTVLTFMLKSNQDKIEYYKSLSDDVISNMIFIDVDNAPIKEIPAKENQNIVLTGERLSFEVPKDKIAFGIFHAPHVDYWDELTALEKDVDYRFEFIMDYYNLGIPFEKIKNQIYEVYSDGRIMLVTLQPYLSMNTVDRIYDGSVLIPKIANGEYDEGILEWAWGLKELNEPVLMRFANEMNGDWTEWCSWNYGLDSDIFIMAWSRVYALFQEVNADNIRFVWNPNDRDYPTYDWNSQYLYYPGDNKVDWIGLTAYNTGVTRPNEEWREFDEAYSELYREYMWRYSYKPFLITEYACNEIGGDKARWIEEGMNSLSINYPNIRIAVWWNGVDDTWIYDIDSSKASKEAFKESMENPYYYFNPVK
jgi:mannan endo-1,4-beta-mannosidase